MSPLRVILVVCGALLLLGIYLWGRRSSRQAVADDDALLRITEPPPEPQGAYALRDESPAFDDVPDDPRANDFGEEPIVANRRYRDEPQIDVDSEDDTVDVEAAAASPAAKDRDIRRPRIEPTLGDQAEAVLSPPAQVAATSIRSEQAAERPPNLRAPATLPTSVAATITASAAPTLSMSSSPPPRRTERRKIIALRVAAGTPRFTGAQLLEALQAEGLEHGKYDVFHRMGDADASVFSVASMVEPGTFDPARMQEETYPGITMFAQFPGPADALLAFNDMVTCARRLHERLGGTLQDERGVPLTVHRVERLRQELRDFELTHAREDRSADVAPLSP